jgi:hypothetical protein
LGKKSVQISNNRMRRVRYPKLNLLKELARPG